MPRFGLVLLSVLMSFGMRMSRGQSLKRLMIAGSGFKWTRRGIFLPVMPSVTSILILCDGLVLIEKQAFGLVVLWEAFIWQELKF